MNPRSALLVLVMAATATTTLPALQNEETRRDQLRRLRAAVRAYGVLHPGQSPASVVQLLDENLLDGPAALVRPGASTVPPRDQLAARADYTLEPMAAADMVVRERAPLPGETEVLAIFKDGTIKALAAPAVASAPAPSAAPGEANSRPVAAPATAAPNSVPTTTAPLPPPETRPASPPVSLPPESSPPDANVAQMLQQANAALAQDNIATARQLYESALRANPNSSDARIGLARCQNAAGELDAAMTSYQAVQRMAPATANLGSWLAELQVAKGDLAMARASLERELRAQPNSAWAWSWLGTVELEAGNRDAAQRNFNRAVQLDPNVVEHRYQNCSWMGRHNQHARAAREAIAVMMMNPNHAGSYYAAGESYARLGQREWAVQYFQRYLQFDPGSQWAAYARQQIAALGQNAAATRRN